MTKKLSKNSFIYVLGDVLNKAVPFFMLPVLTRYLTPSDYGIISIFTVMISIFAVFTGLNIHGAINTNFFHMTKENLRIFIGNCIIILNISTLIVSIIVYFIYPMITERILIDVEWLFIAIVVSFAQFLTTINLLLWTAEKNPKYYNIYQISQTITTALLSLTLIVGFGLGWEGQLIATTVSIILFSVISFIFIVKRGYLIFHLNNEYIKDALLFGVPLIPHTLSTWVKTGADRIILASMVGTSIVGIYTVGYQIGMIISVILIAFNKAWVPYLFEKLADSPSLEAKKNIVKFTYLYFLTVSFFGIIFIYLVDLLLPFVLRETFLSSSIFIKYFTIAFVFQGMYLMVTNYIFYVKKTYILSYVSMSTAILHIILLYFLVKENGAVGAAQASVISFGITFLVVWFFANKVYEMPWLLWKN